MALLTCLALSTYERHISHATLSATSELLSEMPFAKSIMLTIESAGFRLDDLCDWCATILHIVDIKVCQDQ